MWKKSLILFLFSTQAWGYFLTSDFNSGFYWASLPLSMTVVESDPARKATLEKLSKKAMQEWETKSGLSIWDFQVSNEEAVSSNVIRWSTNFAAETGMDPNSVLAVAIRYTSGPYFVKTEIVVNGGHYLNNDTGNLYTTIVHELGHTIGLDHSDVGEAVMAPSLQNPYLGLHDDDIAGMQEAQRETENRQVTGYVSPLAYQETKSTSPTSMGCGTIQGANAVSGSNNIVSLGLGLVIGVMKKVISRIKARIKNYINS